ncbi:MAG: hypothetical protein AB1Z23_02470 [Eubacteriales bacterium]
MKRVILKLVIVLTALFLFAGFAYASWTDDVDVNVNAGTGITRLRITEWNLVSGDGSKISVSRADNKASVSTNNLLDGEQIVISFTAKNTGTIPVDVDIARLYNMVMTNGNKNDDKNITIDVQVYRSGNIIAGKSSKLSDGANGKTVDIRITNNARLISGQEVKVFITMTYEKKSSGGGKDNNGKGNDKNDGNKEVSFEFDLGIIYSRFNQ